MKTFSLIYNQKTDNCRKQKFCIIKLADCTKNTLRLDLVLQIG